MVHGFALLLTILALAVVVTVASLVAADALGPSGLLVVSLALAISAVVLLSLRGLGPLTAAFGCATLVAAASQAAGIDFLGAGEALFERALGRHLL